MLTRALILFGLALAQTWRSVEECVGPYWPLDMTDEDQIQLEGLIGECSALRFARPPPTIRLPARLPCPTRFVPSAASLCNATSHTTQGHSKAKAPCGTSHVQLGIYQETCRDD